MKGCPLGYGVFMRQGLFAILICVVLSVSGCSAGKPDSAASERIQSEAKETEDSKAADAKEKKIESAEEKSKEAAEADKEKSAEKVSKESAASEQKKTEEKKTGDKSAEKTSEESAASEEKKAQEKDTEKKGSPKKEDSRKAGESEKKEETKKEEETKKKEESRKEEKDLKQESKEKYADDYIPEGFTPYGSYVLVYDSGYEVKTRLSKAGLTYYYEGEEFLFTLDKNLPDMTREAAHILFNTAAPMDPANTEGEEFPFGEGFVIYISLDDGSYYEIPSYSLDLNGRVFARDIFETFRQKWEGAF